MKLFILRIVIISFILFIIIASYKIETEIDFFNFLGGILLAITYFFAELITFEENKKNKKI